ncbi:MAG: cupredoxin domain-containing protein [Thermoleophilia bacterium]|nr:cupredoxin domain-containing protein [Thermoleophilia bacterium]
MRIRLVALVIITAIVATFGVAVSYGATKKLSGTVGPGMSISVSKNKVGHGKYTITVHDKSAAHNFHLTGPGVNKKTTVAEVATKTWKVTLKKGTYRFVCDAHADTMKGSFKVT